MPYAHAARGGRGASARTSACSRPGVGAPASGTVDARSTPSPSTRAADTAAALATMESADADA